MKTLLRIAALLLPLVSAPAPAADVYLAPEKFLSETFDGSVPKPSVLWIAGDTRAAVERILGHSAVALRIRYWQHGARSAWILEEIGKTEPITTGFVVDRGALARVAVLVYRESRGWEVRYPFFTDQFKGATLTDMNQLDRGIDGIAGATLSVRALTRLARVALLLDETARAGAKP
jgi:hypothetical protein